MTRAIVQAIVRWRIAVIAFWVVAAALGAPRAAKVHEVLSVDGATLLDTESSQASALISREFPVPVTSFFAVTLSGPLPLTNPLHRAVLDSLTYQAAIAPYIGRVVSYLTTPDPTLVSADGRTSFFIAALGPNLDSSSVSFVEGFRSIMHGTLERIPWAADYTLHVTGSPALDYDVRTVSKEDARHGERRSVPVSAMILVLAFGALVAAVLPLMVGVLAIVCALGVVHELASFYPMSVFVLTIVSMVGLGVGIDYSLLVVTRFREELNRGRSPREAAARTTMTAGRAVVTSGLTVMLGFAALLITPTVETRSVGAGGLLVVTAAVLLSTTLLPGILSLTGRGIDRPRWLARRLAWYHAPYGWERWARWLGHHPWRAIVLGGLVMAVITWPLTQLRIGLPREGWFPSNTESSEGVRVLDDIGARGALQPIRVVIQAPERERIVGARYLRGLRRLSDSIRADPRVAQIRGPVDLEPGMSLLRYTMLYSNLEAARARAPEFFSAYMSDDGRT
ncbi:MAG: MMPL family transporter, partial [Gemmatimonadales bacterium]